MRYRGQGHEIAVPLPAEALDAAALRAGFDAAYAALFGRTIPRLEVEALTWTLSLATAARCPSRRAGGPAAPPRRPPPGARCSTRRPAGARRPRCTSAPALAPGMALDGPGADRRGRDHHRRPARHHRSGSTRSARLVLEDRRGMNEIRLQVMWNRLLSVVEEQARALVRTAFSTSAREAGDISAGVFDLEGRMLAQAVTGTPGT